MNLLDNHLSIDILESKINISLNSDNIDQINTAINVLNTFQNTFLDTLLLNKIIHPDEYNNLEKEIILQRKKLIQKRTIKKLNQKLKKKKQ